jgi:signal peptidase I
VIESNGLNEGGGRGARHSRWRLADAFATGMLCLLVVVLVALIVGTLLGYRALTIKSGSMTPTIAVGAVVVDTSVSPLDVHPGEIVTFRDPGLGEQLVTHRVVSIRRSGNRVFFVTKGDANVVTEHWSIPVTGHLGREVLVVPRVGRILAGMNTAVGRVIEVVLVALCLAYMGLRRIWRRPAPSMAA